MLQHMICSSILAHFAKLHLVILSVNFIRIEAEIKAGAVLNFVMSKQRRIWIGVRLLE